MMYLKMNEDWTAALKMLNIIDRNRDPVPDPGKLHAYTAVIQVATTISTKEAERDIDKDVSYAYKGMMELKKMKTPAETLLWLSYSPTGREIGHRLLYAFKRRIFSIFGAYVKIHLYDMLPVKYMYYINTHNVTEFTKLYVKAKATQDPWGERFMEAIAFVHRRIQKIVIHNQYTLNDIDEVSIPYAITGYTNVRGKYTEYEAESYTSYTGNEEYDPDLDMEEENEKEC